MINDYIESIYFPWLAAVLFSQNKSAHGRVLSELERKKNFHYSIKKWKWLVVVAAKLKLKKQQQEEEAAQVKAKY